MKMDFLVVVGFFSVYEIVRQLLNSTSQAILKELSMIISEFGKLNKLNTELVHHTTYAQLLCVVGLCGVAGCMVCVHT